MIDRLMRKARIKPKDLDGFAVSIGPGSFTGLRIGVAAVKGLAYALGRPVAAVPTLDAIAENAAAFRGAVCPVLDARKNKVYACLYRSDGRRMRRISKYLLLPAAELEKRINPLKADIMFLGNGVSLVGALKAAERQDPKKNPDWHPRAEVVARLGLELFRRGRTVIAEALEPMYIYSKECDITGV
jgi:tRNA threonylcarbamoyladenosine biosynthesis protein TsaB